MKFQVVLSTLSRRSKWPLAALVLSLMLGQPIVSALVVVCSDSFNDGSADGWVSGPTAGGIGNWRVENGRLVQDLGGDHYILLVADLQFSQQSIEARLVLNEPNGYGGVTLWYRDSSNFVNVLFYPHGGVAGIIRVIEKTGEGETITDYPYSADGQIWRTLKVEATEKGALAIYMDNTYLFTHATSTPNRSGYIRPEQRQRRWPF